MDGVICHTGRPRRRFGDDLHERMLSKLTREARRGVKQLRGSIDLALERSIPELIYDAVEKYKVCSLNQAAEFCGNRLPVPPAAPR